MIAMVLGAFAGFEVPASNHAGAALLEERAKHGSVAARFVFAVATHGEVGLMREGGEEVEQVAGVRLLHLCAEGADEGTPLLRSLAREPFRHELRSRRERRQPDVVPVVVREAILRHTARRSADRPDADAFGFRSRCPETDDANGHPVTIAFSCGVRVVTARQYHQSVRRALAIVLCLLGTACTTAQLDLPDGAYAVQGANPRIWNRPISFGPYRTEMVDEGTRRSWLTDLDVLQSTKADQGYHLRVANVDVECHTRELLLGGWGVFVDPAFGGEPLLVCGYGDGEGRAVLTLSRTGKSEPSLRGSLRAAAGDAYEVRSLHRAAGGRLPSLDPWGYEIRQGDERIAMIETVNRGRVWIAPETAEAEMFAAVAASLLLFEDPRAGDE